ncbi:YkgJ family cysteine cluster protein [Desulfospira joergensenii]|uniref:YkgJ family cysteine cluster protein n=1 Tax=Desulfospira joergensenii TaxID=53329 RepID=UPI000527237B|nr:YkgJ family cysteine cluster protein [Desulfospira joergensenii]
MTDFRCIRCHACCRQEGYVRLRPGEADRIARFLEMDLLSFTRKYTRLTRDRQTLSLVEKENKECIFLGNDGCRIHEVKPGQCRDFPLKWKFSEFEKICGWAKNRSRADYNPSMDRPSSSSK